MSWLLSNIMAHVNTVNVSVQDAVRHRPIDPSMARGTSLTRLRGQFRRRAVQAGLVVERQGEGRRVVAVDVLDRGLVVARRGVGEIPKCAGPIATRPTCSPPPISATCRPAPSWPEAFPVFFGNRRLDDVAGDDDGPLELQLRILGMGSAGGLAATGVPACCRRGAARRAAGRLPGRVGCDPARYALTRPDGSAIDRRTTRRALMRKVTLRGLATVDKLLVLASAVNNLIRLPMLLPRPAAQSRCAFSHPNQEGRRPRTACRFRRRPPPVPSAGRSGVASLVWRNKRYVC